MSEIFGPTLQGEGPAAGRRAVFVRLAGCPVGCTWCDTRYTWDPAARTAGDRPTVVAVDRVAVHVRELSSPGDIVVITGGEPLTQVPSLNALLRLLNQRAPQQAPHEATPMPVHLETAGVAAPDLDLLRMFETVVVSPKLTNAGPTATRYAAMVDLDAFASLDNAWFKFVVTRDADLDEIAQLEQTHGLRRIMLMAEGTRADTSIARTRVLADKALARGWSISPRLHIWLWGDERGR